jgi:hypothetical protein
MLAHNSPKLVLNGTSATPQTITSATPQTVTKCSVGVQSNIAVEGSKLE